MTPEETGRAFMKELDRLPEMLRRAIEAAAEPVWQRHTDLVGAVEKLVLAGQLEVKVLGAHSEYRTLEQFIMAVCTGLGGRRVGHQVMGPG